MATGAVGDKWVRLLRFDRWSTSDWTFVKNEKYWDWTCVE